MIFLVCYVLWIKYAAIKNLHSKIWILIFSYSKLFIAIKLNNLFLILNYFI